MFSQLLSNGIIAGSIYALIAFGFAIIYRTVKIIHFAHGAVYTGSIYLAYIFIAILEINPIISILLSVGLSGLLGIVIDRLAYYPLRKRNSSNLVYLLTSFGVFIFIQNILQLIFGAQILDLWIGSIKAGRHIFGATITDIQIIIIITVLIAFVLIQLFFLKTKLGKAIKAVADDSVGARIVGINSEIIILIAFAIGSSLAGVAGILISLETNIEPAMGMSAILKGIIASVIGGIGSIPGALFGGLFLGVAENLGIWNLPAGWKDAIAFAILIIFLLIRPGGIMGVKTKNE